MVDGARVRAACLAACLTAASWALGACGGEVAAPGDAAACTETCNDFEACTVDECVAGTCVHTYDQAACCTSDQCEIDGECFDNAAPNPDNACEICRVVESPSAWSVNAGGTCDDGDPCTSGDACVAGTCRGEAYDCSDGNACTDDVCDGEGGCTNPNNTAPCSDGDACTVGDVCADGACVAGEAADCDDDNACTADSCDAASGCQNEPLDGISCTDPNSCAPSSICVAGACVPEGGDPCDDDNLCTIDACSDASCVHNDISSLCVDTNPCTDDGCSPASGCVFAFNTNGCDDGNLCTQMDACAEGLCVGAPVPVDDFNVCTDDACNPAIGVVNTPNTLPCNDGNACTVGDTCAAGGCVPGTSPLDCDDENVCTDDACDPMSGCTHLDNSARCDDGNACTADRCDPVTGCARSVVQSFACRPGIVVTSPRRAATIEGTLPGVVPVTGTVTSGGGAITSFTINGVTVPVDPATGAFRYDMPARVGANVIVIEATDALGTEDRVVQSYHWSTTYTRPSPTVPGSGAVNPGLGIWLDQDSLDDGRDPPPTDLAAIFDGVLAGIDLSTFIDPTTPIARQSGFDIYVRTLTRTSTSTQLRAIDGGMHVTASLDDVRGNLFFDCTTFTCLLAGGDSTGSLLIDSIVIDADLLISVRPDNTLQVTVANAVTQVNNLRIRSDNGWTNFLLSLIFPVIRDGLVADLEAELTTQLTTVLGPLVEDGLSALAFNQSFALPRLDGSTPGIAVNLASDFAYTDFQDATPGPQGGAFGLRAWASAATRGTPTGYPFDDNRGVPMRISCGSPPQQMVIPRVAPLEIVFPDDTVNQILRGAWWGGLLQFPVDPSLLSGVDLSMYGVSGLNLVVSGWLPPIASDCGTGGDLRLYVGDLRLDARMSLFGQPLDAEVWVSFEAPIRLGANAATGQIEIVVSEVQNVEVEVNVVQESMLSAQPALQSLLETQLVPALGGLLGGGSPLASFPLPEIDLSAALGQPPGTSVVVIEPLTTPPAPERQRGNTIVYGRLR